MPTLGVAITRSVGRRPRSAEVTRCQEQRATTSSPAQGAVEESTPTSISDRTSRTRATGTDGSQSTRATGQPRSTVHTSATSALTRSISGSGPTVMRA